jgi:hypothetical protein
VVRDHAPSLRGFGVHIGGHDPSLLYTVIGQDIHPLDHTVHAAGSGIGAPDPFWMGQNRPVGKQGLKAGTNFGMAHQAWAAGVHTNDVIFIDPTGHESVQITLLQGLVKRGFGIVRGSRWQFDFGHARHCVMQRASKKKPAQGRFFAGSNP